MTPADRRRSVPSNPVRNSNTNNLGKHQTMTPHIPFPNNFNNSEEGAYDVLKGSNQPEDNVYKVPINNARSFKITYSTGVNVVPNVPPVFSVPPTPTDPGSSYVPMDRKHPEDYLPFQPVDKPKEIGPEKKFVQLPYMIGRSNTLPSSIPVPKPNLPDRTLDPVLTEIPEVQPKPVNVSEGMFIKYILYLFKRFIMI